MSISKRRREKKRLERFPLLESDPCPSKTGVLLSDDIEFYVRKGKLIYPFDRTNLKPAAYELTVGDEAMLGGKYYRLGGSTGTHQLEIKPFQVAVIKTGETLNLPRFLIGRWNIRVAWAYKGLVWVGGPQVDPGYVGNLFCPLYNLSNRTVRIKRGDPIAIMDFVKTTPFETKKGNEEWKRYRRPPKRVIIDDFDIDDFQSALFHQSEEIKTELKEMRDKINTFTTLVFGVIAILMAAIAIPYLGVENTKANIRIFDIWTVSLFFSLFFTLLLSFKWMSSIEKGWRRRIIIGTTVILSAIMTATLNGIGLGGAMRTLSELFHLLLEWGKTLI